MTCRAPTCAGSSPTGAQLTYDAERRLASWQNAPTNPTSQAWFLYDGEGHRVEQDVSGGSGNHTYYLPGNVEEVTPSGTLVKYYSAGGLALGLNTTSDSSGSDISYLVSDGLGSVSEALAQTGTASGIQLYSPYDTVRYSSGVMPTAKGYTGQRADSTTGLDYYGARYYDPTVGQFTSADTLLAGGLNRYGYVGGNPETLTDPSGHVEDGLHFDLEGSITGNGAGGLAGLARVILDWVFSPLAGGVLVAAATHQSATTTTTSASLAGTPDTATTFTVNGAAVSVLPSGDIVVTTSGSGGTTTTAYATGSAGWLQWTHDIDVAYADTDVWNARTAPRAVAATSSGSGAGTGSGSGAGTGSGASNPSAANPPANAGASTSGGSSEPPEGNDPCTCSSPNPLENVHYSGKVQSAMGNRWASRDYFHAFPDIIDNYGAYGETDLLPGGDGIVRTRLRIPGGYKSPDIPGEPGTGTWYDGVFEYIIESDGSVNHRLFRPC